MVDCLGGDPDLLAKQSSVCPSVQLNRSQGSYKCRAGSENAALAVRHTTCNQRLGVDTVHVVGGGKKGRGAAASFRQT